ncbi:hypothetical protein ACFLYR_02500 [Chloroflexota bacterium]
MAGWPGFLWLTVLFLPKTYLVDYDIIRMFALRGLERNIVFAAEALKRL